MEYRKVWEFRFSDGSGDAYANAQALILRSECDLSVLRFKLDSRWYVAILGIEPSIILEAQINVAMEHGIVTGIPEDVWHELEARRRNANRLGPWVEGHYPE